MAQNNRREADRVIRQRIRDEQLLAALGDEEAQKRIAKQEKSQDSIEWFFIAVMLIMAVVFLAGVHLFL